MFPLQMQLSPSFIYSLPRHGKYSQGKRQTVSLLYTLVLIYLVNTQSKKKKGMFLRCNHVSFPCCSNEFTDVVEIALKSCTVALVEEMETQPGLATGIQLAKLLPQIEKTVPEISAVPDKNRFLQLIRDLPQVHLFFTLLYSKPL